jgi:L-iditol 2-dehydrogenase
VRALRLHGVGDLRLHDEPAPAAGEGFSLVRVTAVGLCGSDLHWFGEGSIGDARLDRPLVLGHEFAGVVEGGPLSGRRVAVDPAVPCIVWLRGVGPAGDQGGWPPAASTPAASGPGRTCPQCLDGDQNLCPTVRFAGHGAQDGGLREYVAWPTDLLHPLPDEVGDVAGALLEPLGVALHAHDLGHVRIGASVAVVGCGPIGLLLVQVARAAGAGRIVAVDPLEHRRAAATAFGADEAVDPAGAGAEGGGDVDVAFEVAGPDDAVRTALTLARPGARVVLAGIPDDDRTSFPASLARRKGLTLVLVRRMRNAYPRAIRLAQRRTVDVDPVVTHHAPLADAPAGFATAAARQGLKVVVHPT